MYLRLLPRCLVHQSIDRLSRILIQHEDLLELCPRVTQQLETILLGTRQCTLVWKDDPVRVILETAKSDEPFADSNFRTTRHNKPLEIKKECRLWNLLKHSVFTPLLQISCRPRIHIVRSRVRRIALAKNNPDDVIRMRHVITFLHFLRDFVVRL